MSALALRFLVIAGVIAGLYGAGFAHATMRFWRATELAAAIADRDAKAEAVKGLQAQAADTAERTVKLEATKDFLERKVRDYENRIANPVVPPPAPGCAPVPAAACRLSDDDARRLRAIAAGARADR